MTGTLELGAWARRKGLFLTPLETAPAEEITPAPETTSDSITPFVLPPEFSDDGGFIRAVVDPYVNAIHVGLLRVKEELSSKTEVRLEALRAKVLKENPKALTTPDKLLILSDAESMTALHEQVWLSRPDELGQAWRCALDLYSPARGTPSLGLAA